MLQTCASNASSTTRVSTNAAHAIRVRSSVERRSSQKRTVQFHRSMLRQYSAHTESFPDCTAAGPYSPRWWYSPGKSSWNWNCFFFFLNVSWGLCFADHACAHGKSRPERGRVACAAQLPALRYDLRQARAHSSTSGESPPP